MDEVPVDREVELTRLRKENALLRQQAELNRVAHDYLARLAHHFSNEEVVFEGPQEIRTFCERIRRSIGIMVGEFRELLTGRRRFQLDYDLVPAAHSRASGPSGGTQILRLGDLHGDLGRYLFYWRPRKSEDEVSQDQELKTAIEELKHHQMALLTGFEHAVREGSLAVLEHVSPETVETHLFKGGRSLFWRLSPFRAGRCWREFRRRFQHLSAEDAGWFQKRFLPSFREGYKEYMWAKIAAQAGERSPSNEGEK